MTLGPKFRDNLRGPAKREHSSCDWLCGHYIDFLSRLFAVSDINPLRRTINGCRSESGTTDFLDNIWVATVKVEFVLILGVAVFAGLALVGAADSEDALLASVLVGNSEAPAANFVASDWAGGDLELEASAGTDVGLVVGEVGELEATLNTLEDGHAFLAQLGELRDVKVFLLDQNEKQET